MPLVSVILPAFNAREFISQAVQSILNQSFRDFELLVIDDGSTDGTTKILESITDPRLRVISHDTNQGLIYSLNEGIAESKGQLIARMDADDVSHPDRLDIQVNFLLRNPDIGVVGTAIQLIDRQGKTGPIYAFPESHSFIEWSISFFCPIAHPSVMVRSSVIRQAGGYRSDALHAEDYDLWERLSSSTQFYNLPKPLLLLRKHEGNITETQKEKHLESSARVAQRHIERLLARNVDIGDIKCLYSLGREMPIRIMGALLLIKMLLAKCPTIEKRATQQDAASRLMLLGIRSKSFINFSRCIFAAHTLYPGIIIYMIVKQLSKYLFISRLMTRRSSLSN